MSRTFISQPTQIFNSEYYDDSLTVDAGLQVSASNLQGDLNALRTQVRRILWASVSGSWYDGVTGSVNPRGLNTINTDLYDIEQKRFLFRRQNLNIVNIGTGSNYALLSVSLGTAPADYIAASTTATGSVVFVLSSGSYGAFNTGSVAGSTAITPKNLVVLRDAYTGAVLSAPSGKDIFGLIQIESGSLDGEAFNDTTKRTQLSFVVETILNGTSSLSASDPSWIGGKTVNYSYIRRVDLDSIPEDAYLSNTIFIDMPDTPSGSYATLADITLDRAIDNQVGTATMDQNIAVRIASGFSWTFLSGTQELWKLVSSNTGDSLTVNVDTLGFSSSNPAAFQQGLLVTTGSTQINVGVWPGYINTLSGSNLIMSGGSRLVLSDYFQNGSLWPTSSAGVPLSENTAEWNNYFNYFGTSSILSAFYLISSSFSGSLQKKRSKYIAGTTPSNINENVNVSFPTNIDAQLGDYSTKAFSTEVDIYLNGVLLFPGVSAGLPNDVYPGTSQSNGDLKFPMKLRSGSIITMILY